MDYPTFSNHVRDQFDNVFAIHWKGSSLEHIKVLIEHLRNNGYRVQFQASESELNELVDFYYIERFFQNKEVDYPSLTVEDAGFMFNCFLEHEESISLWFNDGADTSMTELKLDAIKDIMKDIAVAFNRTVYFVNEGEATHRYKIFKISSECIESDYDLSNEIDCAEKLS